MLTYTCGNDLEVLFIDAKIEFNFNEFVIFMCVVSGGVLDGKIIRGVDLVNVLGLFCMVI